MESLLLRFQIRLAQHQADLTDDYQIKVQILTNAYHEQQILLQKVLDEKMKQRLENIEQNTKEYNIKQLHLLREKYFDIIKLYLHRCTELHKSVPLTGLNGDVVAKVAQNFYQISSEDQIRLEQQWQSYDLPLTRTFIQFKPDKSTSFERNESRRLLNQPENNSFHGEYSRKKPSNAIWKRLVSAPYMMSMIERDRHKQEEDVSEENIIRTKRWIVILGDPGSGKTSFARWLVHHLAQTLLLNGQHSTEYGPLRIPILIRIGEFAEMLREQSSLTLFDYIGKHKWMGKSLVNDSLISLDHLSVALQDYIKYGQALIILDGLDEIPVSDQRSKIINIVENFVETYVQTPTGVSAFDNAYLTKLLDDPSRSGGNQLIVTSRIVGYHAAPLAGQFSHYTIRPMDMEHMKDFVDYWFFRVHQQILDTLDLTINNQGENHGEALKNELEKQENNGLLDVASNSCLMSFVCSVAFSQLEGSPLPTQRIRLYEAIVHSMLTLWTSKRSTIPIENLIRILSNIAFYIHEHSASGLIHEKKMKEICIQSIKDPSIEQFFTESNHEEIEEQACEFVRIIREDVGILAARGESLYGFLHLTFQEYFTCLKLINIDTMQQENLFVTDHISSNRIHIVAQSLRQYVNDPRFRVPIALALGKISLSWFRKDFNSFCLEFIREYDDSKCLLPLGAYMLISCGNDLVNYPSNNVLFDALNCLMIAAGEHKWSVVYPFLFDQIRNALQKLRHDVVSLWINNFLSQNPPYDIQTISALCHLLEGKPHEFENIKWLNPSSCLILQQLSLLDNETNEFAIDRLLVKIAFSNHRLLPVDSISFKGFLLGQEIELNSIPTILFPLIISLYGGLKRVGRVVLFDPFYIHRESIALTPILVRFLGRNIANTSNEIVNLIEEECSYALLTRIKNEDESPETVDLCIANICLNGVDYIQNNRKDIPNSLIHKSMHRLKYISMILRQFYFTNDENDYSIENETTKFIGTIIENFQYMESERIQFLDLINSLKNGLVRLRSSATSFLLQGVSLFEKRLTLYLPKSLKKENFFLNDLLCNDIQFYSNQNSCSLLHHFTKLFWILEDNNVFNTQYRTAVTMDTIPEYLLFHHDEDLLFSLTFIPSHLQNLYLQLLKKKLIIISQNNFLENDKQHLYFSHILIECLMLLSNASSKRLTLLSALITLLPLLRMCQLENFGSSLLWALTTKDSNLLNIFNITSHRPMDNETGQYIEKMDIIPIADKISGEESKKIIQDCIQQEYERLRNVCTDNKDDRSDMKLYSASITLAHICHWSTNERKLSLLKESIQGAMLITNKLVRLDALCVISFYTNEIQIGTGRSMREEIEYQLNDIYSNLPLLLHLAIFIRCLPLIQNPQMINQCLQNLFEKFNNADQYDQQIVYETLSPYFQLTRLNKTMHNKYFNWKIYLNMNIDTNFLISNMYLSEITSNIHNYIRNNDPHYQTMNELFYLENSILTVGQALTITNILLSTSSTHLSEQLKQFLNNTLHHVDLIEFKARHLVESWMKWKDHDNLSLFAYHAALLLINSDLWSVESTEIICDLLCNTNDCFRQKAETILRSSDQIDIRASSKLGIDVLLTLGNKKAYYQFTSPFATLTLYRMLDSITIDVQSHLDCLLWLERYRIHALINKEYSLKQSKLFPMSYFPTDITIQVLFCDNISRISDDLMKYMCHHITSNFISFIEIDDDTTSDIVLKSHAIFVVSILVSLIALAIYNDDTRIITIDALIILIETSKNNKICQAVAYALGYICDEHTYKILYKKIEIEMTNENPDHSINVLSSLISSYSHCISICNFDFDDDDMNLFRKLLKHSSPNVLKSVHIGLARILKNTSILYEMLDSDYIQCYHALIGSTTYVFVYDIQQIKENAIAEFIEQHPDLLSIFVVELYNHIRQFTNNVQHVKTTDYYLAYTYPQYVAIAGSIAIRMPAAFCAYIKDWCDGENFKQALFYTSKQHERLQRAGCLTILSIFGELTVELCEMIIEGLRDDPHIQNTCYKCLNRIISIKDKKIVLNLLFSYLKSKSMNARYFAAKMLLHLSQSSLISSDQVQKVLNTVMLDPESNENLWLIEEQDEVRVECRYYCAGLLKDVIYSLLVQHLTGNANEIIRRNPLNQIDLDFIESGKAARLASCLYEEGIEEDFSSEPYSTKIKVVD